MLDTGVDPEHPDLNVVGGTDCTGGNDWSDGFGHGTHVAGTIGAYDNAFGVVGVAPGVRLWSVRVLDANGYGSPATTLCGLNWVLDNADTIEVANLSMRLTECRIPFPFNPITDEIPQSVIDQYDKCVVLREETVRVLNKLQNAGVVVVFAAGNDSANTAYNHWWMEVPGIIGVGAFADYDGQPGGAALTPSDACNGPFGWFGEIDPDLDDQYAGYSDWGRWVDVVAPGTCVLSTLPGGEYGYMTGTSMATPHVSGLAAILKAQNPNLYGWQVEIMLELGANEHIEGEPVVNLAGAEEVWLP